MCIHFWPPQQLITEKDSHTRVKHYYYSYSFYGLTHLYNSALLLFAAVAKQYQWKRDRKGTTEREKNWDNRSNGRKIRQREGWREWDRKRQRCGGGKVWMKTMMCRLIYSTGSCQAGPHHSHMLWNTHTNTNKSLYIRPLCSDVFLLTYCMIW